MVSMMGTETCLRDFNGFVFVVFFSFPSDSGVEDCCWLQMLFQSSDLEDVRVLVVDIAGRTFLVVDLGGNGFMESSSKT